MAKRRESDAPYKPIVNYREFIFHTVWVKVFSSFTVNECTPFHMNYLSSPGFYSGGCSMLSIVEVCWIVLEQISLTF